MSMDYPERNVKYECASYKSVYLLDISIIILYNISINTVQATLL